MTCQPVLGVMIVIGSFLFCLFNDFIDIKARSTFFNVLLKPTYGGNGSSLSILEIITSIAMLLFNILFNLDHPYLFSF